MTKRYMGIYKSYWKISVFTNGLNKESGATVIYGYTRIHWKIIIYFIENINFNRISTLIQMKQKHEKKNRYGLNSLK